MVNIQDGVLNSSNHFNSVLVRISKDKIQDGSSHYGGFSNGQASIIYLRSRPFANHLFKHSKSEHVQNSDPHCMDKSILHWFKQCCTKFEWFIQPSKCSVQWGFENQKYLNTKIIEVQISNGSVFRWSAFGLYPMN